MIQAVKATISVIVIPSGIGSPTKKSSAWSSGAIKTYEIDATIPVNVATLGFLKIRISDAISRIVVLRKNGINAKDLSADNGRVSNPAGVKRNPQTDMTANVVARIFSFLFSFIL